MYEVHDWEQDEAGKFRFRVLINGQSVMFKFQTMPTDEEVQAEAARYAAIPQEQTELAALTQEQADGAPNPD